MGFTDRATLLLATGFCAGKMPYAPGTFGTVVGLPVAYIVSFLSFPFAMLFVFLFTGFAILVAHRAEILMERKDPGEIVIDEMAGIVITFVNLTINGWTLAAGFILFRVFDILKPYPIRWIDRRIPGGGGVVLDDVIAGIYANLILILIGPWLV